MKSDPWVVFLGAVMFVAMIGMVIHFVSSVLPP